jgi:hypothetical protein
VLHAYYGKDHVSLIFDAQPVHWHGSLVLAKSCGIQGKNRYPDMEKRLLSPKEIQLLLYLVLYSSLYPLGAYPQLQIFFRQGLIREASLLLSATTDPRVFAFSMYVHLLSKLAINLLRFRASSFQSP